MNLDALLLPADAGRVGRSLATLTRAGFVDFAVTGGLAIRAHLARAGVAVTPRPLNNLNTVVASFGAVPGSLAEGFMFPHVHAGAAEGKTLLQLVAPDEALRIDVFRAFGDTMGRAGTMTVGEARVRVVSCEDIAARTTALLLGLRRGKQVDPKHARDFEALVGVVVAGRVEEAWRDHRHPEDPEGFADGVRTVREALATHGDRLVPGVYEADVTAICPRCRDDGAFRVADKRRVVSVLGYC